jgi:hypothetical protein
MTCSEKEIKNKTNMMTCSEKEIKTIQTFALPDMAS